MKSAGGHDPAASLARLRADFPGYRIWSESNRNRERYIARRLDPGTGPHTVVTDNLAELRAALSEEPGQASVDSRGSSMAPNIAGMYDYWLHGRDHWSVDREAADGVTAEFPGVALVARANREFVGRAVAHVAAHGITQYLDIGSGLPARPAVHEIARRAVPGARVAYVDYDKAVLAQARALLADPGVVVIDGDLREPAAILAAPALRALIDLNRPVCLLLASVLHFLPEHEADSAVSTLTTAISPGSYLIISAGTRTGTSAALIDRLRTAYAPATIITARSQEEIAAWLDGLDLLPPGLTDVWAWRPVTPQPMPVSGARFIGGVARKPGPAS